MSPDNPPVARRWWRRPVVPALLLATAGVPSLVGADSQLRISSMGGTGDPTYEASQPAVAADPGSHRLLVVWSGSDDTSGLAIGELEIFGRLIDAATGIPVTPRDIRLSDAGGTGDPNFSAFDPSVVFNPDRGEFLVTWAANDIGGGLDADELEIFVQRVDAATGAPIGVNDERISAMAGLGAPFFEAYAPAAAYNPVAHEYLVVWQGENDPMMPETFEIFGQRLDAVTATPVGSMIQISSMASAGGTGWGAQDPDVAYNPDDDEYLVVWSGASSTGGSAVGETEIYLQRLSAASASATGVDDLRISQMGGNGSGIYSAMEPSVAYNPDTGEYLAVWVGSDSRGGLVVGETEVFVQRLDGTTGMPLGTIASRISDMGGIGDPAYDAASPVVVYDAVRRDYLVVWAGDDLENGGVDGELEIFGQRLTGDDAAEIGANDLRLGTTGPAGSTVAAALNPAVAWDGTAGGTRTIRESNPGGSGLHPLEFEIFGNGFESIFSNGFETGGIGAWSFATP